MKQHLLLVLVALGLVVVTPTVAQAEVHFGFSLGFPAYYGASPDLCHRGYYPYYVAIHTTDPIGLNAPTGIDVHIHIAVTIIAKTLEPADG
jgi:hypothetical protein